MTKKPKFTQPPSPHLSKFENYTLSTRRIFHIFADATKDEKWEFRDSYFGQWGTGILIKKGMKYFLLTAYHVLKDYLELELPNTSPFRVTNLSGVSFRDTNDFIYPKRVWKIGELIPDHQHYNFSDVVLVEMFNLHPGQSVDHFLDFDEMDILSMSDYVEGIALSDSGFSEESNPYFFEGDNDTLPFDENLFSTSTRIKRDMISGLLKKDELGFFFEIKSKKVKSTNGMSGGLITAIDKHGDSKLLGMHVSGSSESNAIRFVPMCEIYKAIKNYLFAESVIIDYCYIERLRENIVGIGGIGKYFEERVKIFPEIHPRKSDGQRGHMEDLADFVHDNKEFFLVNALDYGAYKGDFSNYYEMLDVILNFEQIRNDRIKQGRP